MWIAWIHSIWPAPERFRSTICRRRSNIAKQMEINQNDHLFTFKNTKTFKICQLHKQIWTAWIRTTWPAPERFRSTICRRRSNIAKQLEINQNDHLFTFKNTQIFKICQLYKQIWTAWIRTTWPVPERFRSTICRRRSNIAKRMKITQNHHFETSKNTNISKNIQGFALNVNRLDSLDFIRPGTFPKHDLSALPKTNGNQRQIAFIDAHEHPNLLSRFQILKISKFKNFNISKFKNFKISKFQDLKSGSVFLFFYFF